MIPSILWGCFLLPSVLVLKAEPQNDPLEFFETRIRPVLANNCFACHTSSQMGGLQLDSRESLLKGGKSGPAIVPGKPEVSLLVRAVNQTDERLKMPLGGRLKDQEIADLATWVKMGAPWPVMKKAAQPAPQATAYAITAEQKAFWSFQPIHEPALPEVKDTSWVKSPIDRFILARLEAQGLKPVKAADKRTLIRRASFDLTGLPPTPGEVEAFLNDSSPQAFAKVVDRLLASPHYGERWGRYWLDVARYGEDDARGLSQESYPNAFRYRDWVIQAFNEDMPYDLFVKAQIAGDLLERKDRDKFLPGLGFFGLGPWYYDITVPLQARADERHDRVDVLTRGFLGLTVACARCHDHKFDPISTKDYYALAGVFSSSQYKEYPLAPELVVNAYHQHQKKIKDQEAAIKQFMQTESRQLGEILARKISRYMLAAWKVLEMQREAQPAPSAAEISHPTSPGVISGLSGAIGAGSDESSQPPTPRLEAVAAAEKLDPEILERWVRYLGNSQRDHPYLNAWNDLLKNGGPVDAVKKVADEFQGTVLAIIDEKKSIDERNRVILEQNKPPKNAAMTSLPNGFATYEEFCPGCSISIESLERDKFVLWSDLFAAQIDSNDPAKKAGGVLLFQDEKLDRFLGPEWQSHLQSMRAELESLKKALPAPYPYLHGFGESAHPANLKVHLRGSPFNLGEEVQRRFLAVLSDGEPTPFRKGSGRLELAEAIVNHPLTARVMVNRIWKQHFGQGIVGTPSNFGRLGERPSHPGLLEYLASRFRESHWSIKTMHREIMLSAVYELSSENTPKNFADDPDNRLFWRANRRRLDAEAMRDSLLFVTGSLNSTLGGPSCELDVGNQKRTVYGKVSRFRLNSSLALFDFPNPAITSEQRNVTHVPLQKLFFLNSDLIAAQAQALANRLNALSGADESAKIQRAYQLLFGRNATEAEVRLGIEFLHKSSSPSASPASSWPQYAQVLLSSNEFLFVD